jgi:hypothetical protein
MRANLAEAAAAEVRSKHPELKVDVWPAPSAGRLILELLIEERERLLKA